MLILKPDQRGSHPWRRIGFAFFLMGVLSGLAACAPVGPNYRPPQLELPVGWNQAFAEKTQRTVNDELARWWTLFNDPLLNSLIQRALAANHDVKIAEARVRQARAQYRLAATTNAPTVDATGAYSNRRRSSNAAGAVVAQDLFQAGFDAGWELDIFGAGRRAAEAAAARLIAAEEQGQDVRISLAAEVARNYLELRGSQQRLATAHANIAVLTKTLELASGRREYGLGNQLEVIQAETQLALARADLAPLEENIGQSGYRVSLLLGLSPRMLDDELSDTAPLPVPPSLIPRTLPSDLLRRRPDIRSAERLLAAATADVGVATAELFPHFSLTGLVGLQSDLLGELLSSGSRYWTAGANVQWSLFNAGRVRANIDLNQARREEAEVLYEKTVLTAINEVETAMLTLLHEADSRLALASAVAGGEQAVELATQRYRAGLTGFLDVLQSERTFFQSRELLSLSEQRLSTNLVALYKALGGGWSLDPDSATATSATSATDQTIATRRIEE